MHIIPLIFPWLFPFHISPPWVLAPLGWVRFHGMGRTPGAALRACSRRAPPPSPLPSRCKSDSAAFAQPSVWLLFAWALRFALPGFCPQRLVFVAGCGWSLSFNVLGLLLLLGCLLFCCFGGPAPCVVFLFLLVLWLAMVLWCWSLLLVFVFLMARGCWAVFFLLVVVCWRLGASARLGCSSSSLAWLRWRLSCGVCLLVLWGFCFLLSNCPLQLLLMVCVAFFASGLLLLPLLLFFSSSFSLSSSSWLSSSLAVCVLCGLLPASLAWHCLVSGLPLCLVWSAPPDLFLLSFLFCPPLCGVGGVVAVLAVVVVVGVCSPLVYGQRLFAGVAVVGLCSPLVLVWLVGGGVCSPLLWGQHLFVGVVGGWCLFAFGFGVVGWWSAFSRLWCEASVCSLAWWWLALVCSPLVLAWLVGGGVCLPVVAPCLLAG